jgi:cobalt-precorrin 5A hydrolase
MKKSAVCFTRYGKELIIRMNKAAEEAGIGPVEAYCSKEICNENDRFFRTYVNLSEWSRQRFEEGSALIFVGAVGIAVRAIADCVRDKLTDSPVIVIDDMGNYVIPILSGHAGGANKLAVILADLIGAHPVITTSTDVHGAFSADVFAREQGLTVRNRDGIRKVSAKAIEGKTVTLSVKDYPPGEPVDIIIADETDREYSLLLSPKKYTLGIGMKKGTDPLNAEAFISGILRINNIITDDIYAVCTIDIKQEEPAIRAFCDKFRLPLITFDAALLSKAEGDFTSSDFVKQTVGVDNVCERAAVLGAGRGASLIVRKTAGEGITVAVAARNPAALNPRGAGR